MATEPDVAALWDAEIERRAAEVEADIADTMSLEEYRADVRARRAERARVIDDAHRGAAPSLSDEERRELDDRLREDDEDPDGAIPWAEARVQLRREP